MPLNFLEFLGNVVTQHGGRTHFIISRDTRLSASASARGTRGHFTLGRFVLIQKKKGDNQ
jgi:hypothetical protein